MKVIKGNATGKEAKIIELDVYEKRTKTNGYYDYKETIEYLIDMGIPAGSAKATADLIYGKGIHKTEKPKFKTVLTHSEIESLKEPFKPTSKKESLVPKLITEISKKVNTTQLSKLDYVGKVETEEYGEMEKWEKGIGFLVKSIDFLGKMEERIPKPNAILDKVIKILIYLTQQEANKSGRDVTEAKGSFYIKDIAKYLGLEEQIKKGEMDYKEIRRTLITGACLVYEYPHKINGIDYKYYGSWYSLEAPDDNEHEWFYEFHGLYGRQIIKVINTGGVQYIKHLMREIRDRKTTKKQYYHYFYNQLKFNNLSKSIGNLLSDMGIKKDKLARPKECFDILKDCLVYFGEKYPEELECFYISKYHHKPKTGIRDKILINISDAFKRQSFDDFKAFLKSRGIEDIRKAFISFVGSSVKTKHFVLTEADEELIEEILQWAEDWEEYMEGNEIPYTKDKRYKFLSDYIRLLGHEKVEDSWNTEQARETESYNGSFHADDPIGYFTKRLPALLKEDKENKKKPVNK